MSERIVEPGRIESLKSKMKKYSGWAEEEMENLTMAQWSLLDRQHKLKHYDIIAQVDQINDHCDCKPKIGDKYVFRGGGILIPEKSTFPIVCLWALAGIYPFTLMVMDRILSDQDPNDIFRNRTGCMDSSVRDGGLGRVIFKIYAKKI